ncbi:DUF58 domain-containing protein [Candidatus Poribacteria bacterium]|nr:DUF58 domain-containing protein [Candidatus Poribacteria bacterium]
MPLPARLEDAASVRKLELMTRRIVNEVMAGEYHSVFRGQGMDFNEVREYQPGDDIRQIDWNVTARTGVPHIKRYVEERELTVIFAVDVSASTLFGSVARRKRPLAAIVTAVLAFSAIRNNDRVGLMLFSDEVEKYIQPRKGRSHGLRVITDLLVEPVRKGTNITGALQSLNRMQRKRAVIFLISDFQQADIARALSITNRRHDVIAVSITDPREITIPDAGLIDLEDAETGERLLVDTSSRAVRGRIEGALRARREDAAKLLRQLQIDHIELRTDQDFARPLVEFFERRAARLSRE